jgi:SAM-dependent methyltransferase
MNAPNPAPKPIRLVNRDCPLCGTHGGAVNANSYGEWTIRDCANCGFSYIDTAPEYEHLFEDLDWDTTYASEIVRKKKMRPLSYAFSRLTRWRMGILPKRTVRNYVLARHRSGNIVDLGCGSGGQIANMVGEFTPFGVEISSKLAAEADAVFKPHGGHVVNAPCTEGLKSFADNFFTAASLRSYLEHEMNPKDVVRELFRVLKPGGIAVVKVPNYACWNRHVMGKRWCGFRYPDHLNYFTPRSLKRLAAEIGFKVSFGLTGRLPTSDNMWAVLIK